MQNFMPPKSTHKQNLYKQIVVTSTVTRQDSGFRGTMISFRKFGLSLVFCCGSFMNVSLAEWRVDLSREAADMQGRPIRLAPEPAELSAPRPQFSVYNHQPALQGNISDVVVLYTDEGFLPRQLQLRAGQGYRLHIVNINDKKKNISFVLDKFSQYHGVYFAKKSTFEIQPGVEGVYSFMCPETNEKGRLVILKSDGSGLDALPSMEPITPTLLPIARPSSSPRFMDLSTPDDQEMMQTSEPMRAVPRIAPPQTVLPMRLPASDTEASYE